MLKQTTQQRPPVAPTGRPPVTPNTSPNGTKRLTDAAPTGEQPRPLSSSEYVALPSVRPPAAQKHPLFSSAESAPSSSRLPAARKPNPSALTHATGNGNSNLTGAPALHYPLTTPTSSNSNKGGSGGSSVGQKSSVPSASSSDRDSGAVAAVGHVGAAAANGPHGRGTGQEELFLSMRRVGSEGNSGSGSGNDGGMGKQTAKAESHPTLLSSASPRNGGSRAPAPPLPRVSAIQRVTPNHVKPLVTTGSQNSSAGTSPQSHLTLVRGGNGHSDQNSVSATGSNAASGAAGTPMTWDGGNSPSPATTAVESATISPRPPLATPQQRGLSAEEVSKHCDQRRPGPVPDKRRRSKQERGESNGDSEPSSSFPNEGEKRGKKNRKGSLRNSVEGGSSLVSFSSVTSPPSPPPVPTSHTGRTGPPSAGGSSAEEADLPRPPSSRSGLVNGSFNKRLVAVARRTSFPRRPSTRDKKGGGGGGDAAVPMNISEAALKDASLSLDDVVAGTPRPLSRQPSNLSQRQVTALQRTPSFLSRHHTPPPALLQEEIRRAHSRRRRVPIAMAVPDFDDDDDDEDDVSRSTRASKPEEGDTSRHSLGSTGPAAAASRGLVQRRRLSSIGSRDGHGSFKNSTEDGSPTSSGSSHSRQRGKLVLPRVSSSVPPTPSGAATGSRKADLVEVLSISNSSASVSETPLVAVRHKDNHLPRAGTGSSAGQAPAHAGQAAEVAFAPVGMPPDTQLQGASLSAAPNPSVPGGNGREGNDTPSLPPTPQPPPSSPPATNSPGSASTGSVASPLHPRGLRTPLRQHHPAASTSLNVSYSVMESARAASKNVAPSKPDQHPDHPLPLPPSRASSPANTSGSSAPGQQAGGGGSVTTPAISLGSPAQPGRTQLSDMTVGTTMTSQSTWSFANSEVTDPITPNTSAHNRKLTDTSAGDAAAAGEADKKARVDTGSGDSPSIAGGGLSTSDGNDTAQGGQAAYLAYANKVLQKKRSNGTLSSPTATATTAPGVASTTTHKKPSTVSSVLSSPPATATSRNSVRERSLSELDASNHSSDSGGGGTGSSRQKQRLVHVYFDEDEDEDIFGKAAQSASALDSSVGALAPTVSGGHSSSTATQKKDVRPIKQDLVQPARRGPAVSEKPVKHQKEEEAAYGYFDDEESEEECDRSLLEGFRPEGFGKRRGSRVKSGITFFLSKEEDSFYSDDEVVEPAKDITLNRVGSANLSGPRPCVTFALYQPPRNSALRHRLYCGDGHSANDGVPRPTSRTASETLVKSSSDSRTSFPTTLGMNGTVNMNGGGGALSPYDDMFLFHSDPRVDTASSLLSSKNNRATGAADGGNPMIADGYQLPDGSCFPYNTSISASISSGSGLYSIPQLSSNSRTNRFRSDSPPVGGKEPPLSNSLLPPPATRGILLATGNLTAMAKAASPTTTATTVVASLSKYAPDPDKIHRPIPNTFGLRGRQKRKALAAAAASTEISYDDFDEEDSDLYDDEEEEYEWYWEEVEEDEEDDDVEGDMDNLTQVSPPLPSSVAKQKQGNPTAPSTADSIEGSELLLSQDSKAAGGGEGEYDFW